MLVTYKKCDLCDNKIDAFSNELNVKYKAKMKAYKYFSTDDVECKLPISTEWKEIDVCEDCLKEIIKRKHEKDKEQG